MCGRYTITASAKQIAERFAAEFLESETQWLARYNAAPSQQLPVVLWKNQQRVLSQLHWGLIPAWAKDSKMASKMINARQETITEKPSFRQAFARRRCLVPADGLYEWQQLKRGKQPYRFVLTSGELFAFAGIWESWHSPDGKIIDSFSIITTTPNELVAEVHDRMAVILPKHQEQSWLDPATSSEQCLDLLRPYPATQMRCYPVSKNVSSARVDNPTLIEPIALDMFD